jgi:glycerophosphoryl diester phosphodiesterase
VSAERRFPLAALGLLLAGCGSEEPTSGSASTECAPKDHVLLCGERLLIAHRGGGALAPEETLPAFENALALGADVLELDVHSTSDGRVVCLHDDTVDRTTDGTGPIHGLTLAELGALDAGYHFSPDGGASFPFRGQGIRVPTLAEVLAAHPDAWWSIEIKQSTPSIVDEVLADLELAGASERAVVVSFFDTVVLDVRAKRPDVLTGMALGEMTTFLGLSSETEAGYTAPTRLVQPPSNAVSAELVARANRMELRLHPWTVNDELEMRELLDLGAHGIMTDDPALLAQVLASP